MGACISTSNREHRLRKIFLRSRKYDGKISASIPDAPIASCDTESHFVDSELIHVETAAKTHRKSEFSNLTFQQTPLQWQHSQMDSNVLCQDEAWFDSVSILESETNDDFVSVHGVLHQKEEQYSSVSILESDSDDDFISVHGVGSAFGTPKLLFENASCFVDGTSKLEEICDDTQRALTVEQHLKRVGGRTEKPLSKDEIPTGKADERKNVLEHLHDSFKGSKEDRHNTGEKAYENTLKQMTSSCTHHVVSSATFSDKTEQFNCASPPCQKRKPAVIMLSLKKKSKDGDETTGF